MFGEVRPGESSVIKVVEPSAASINLRIEPYTDQARSYFGNMLSAPGDRSGREAAPNRRTQHGAIAGTPLSCRDGYVQSVMGRSVDEHRLHWRCRPWSLYLHLVAVTGWVQERDRRRALVAPELSDVLQRIRKIHYCGRPEQEEDFKAHRHTNGRVADSDIAYVSGRYKISVCAR
jgi:hypothetical protein